MEPLMLIPAVTTVIGVLPAVSSAGGHGDGGSHG
jgi:hypothetical protein